MVIHVQDSVSEGSDRTCPAPPETQLEPCLNRLLGDAAAISDLAGGAPAPGLIRFGAAEDLHNLELIELGPGSRIIGQHPEIISLLKLHEEEHRPRGWDGLWLDPCPKAAVGTTEEENFAPER